MSRTTPHVHLLTVDNIQGALRNFWDYDSQLLTRWDTLRVHRWTAPLKDIMALRDQVGLFGLDEPSRVWVTNWESDRKRLERLLRQRRLTFHSLEERGLDSRKPEHSTLLRQYLEDLCASKTSTAEQ